MTQRRNRIVMIKRANPKKVTLPNGRKFYARYKRVTRDALPANVHLVRPYKQRAAPKGTRRRRAVGQRGRGFKSFSKKGLSFAKKAFNNKSVRNIAKALISEAPVALEAAGRKVNNKKLKKIPNSDLAKTGVDLASGFALDKLQ